VALRGLREEPVDAGLPRARVGGAAQRPMEGEAGEVAGAVAAKVLRATWQRCRVHCARNALAHAGKAQRRIVSAWIGTAYAQEDAAAAHAPWRTVADPLRPKVTKLATLMDAAEEDVLAYMHFPAAHQAKLHSTKVGGIFPNQAAVIRLVGAIPLEQSDEWTTQRARHMTQESISAVSDTPHVSLSAVTARHGDPPGQGSSLLHHAMRQDLHRVAPRATRRGSFRGPR
jgi:hypothetical protein